MAIRTGRRTGGSTNSIYAQRAGSILTRAFCLAGVRICRDPGARACPSLTRLHLVGCLGCDAVRAEPVVDAPQNGPGPTVHAHLPVRRADVGLDGVDAHVGRGCDLLVAEPLRDQRDHLRLAGAEPVVAAGPVAQVEVGRRWIVGAGDPGLALVDPFERV